MKTVRIKRTRGDVPLMIFITGVFLFPGLYFMYENSPASIAFIIAALFTLLVIVIAVFGFRVIFKYHSSFILTNDGVSFQDNDEKKSGMSFFYRWEDVSAFRVETETNRYYSNETNTYQESDVYYIVLILEDGSLVRVSADKLSKRADEIIGLFDLYKRGRVE